MTLIPLFFLVESGRKAVMRKGWWGVRLGAQRFGWQLCEGPGWSGVSSIWLGWWLGLQPVSKVCSRPNACFSYIIKVFSLVYSKVQDLWGVEVYLHRSHEQEFFLDLSLTNCHHFRQCLKSVYIPRRCPLDNYQKFDVASWHIPELLYVPLIL